MTFKQISYSVDFQEFEDAQNYLNETIMRFKKDGYTIQKVALKSVERSESEKVGFRPTLIAGERSKTFVVQIKVWRKP
ncbi:hypothetical protein M3M35_07190 [Fructilactobacillus myrtifloralis]|uniref:Phage protein n=1 Tax=Fructilactobacillus myrtifloralis TaxID=2940301 RepID=A0ABY5BPG0_9LACO|nr:hypothetical protein [Fructilactobacillus myrtifloralis]USS85066.1 hypothetical protein M3M35_07190 [Fructilactobacillus myrtifloralis]